jgi:uncharacterized Fe-S cluster-containing radical SAM superfamily protein
MDMIATESKKFVDPRRTAAGEPRARVALSRLETLWLNTGTLCNLTCENCYIESSPRNDALSYLTRAEVRNYLAEIAAERLPVWQIGITGGEPFMNPDILAILEDCLERGFQVVVLTNAMRPMMKCADGLQRLAERFGPRLTVRVSLDHPDPARHEEERGRRSWQPTLQGLKWLGGIGVELNVAGRTRWGEDESALRAGFEALFHREGIPVAAWSDALVLFPEMDERADVPEITTACWGILGVDPASVMCASARMVVKRKGAPHPEVVACTLLPYDARFRLGSRLVESLGPVALNHPHCAKFCVLGGGSCAA